MERRKLHVEKVKKRLFRMKVYDKRFADLEKVYKLEKEHRHAQRKIEINESGVFLTI